MLGQGGSNGNTIFMKENRVRCENNMLPKLQVFEHVPGDPGVGTISHMGNGQFPNYYIAPMNRAGIVCTQEKLHMSESVGIRCALDHNVTSTGLKLSFEEDERNSTITSGENTGNPLALSLGTAAKLEIDQYSKELSRFIKLKEQNMLKGIREMSQRHTVPLLSALEKSINQKLHEKNLAIENMNQKNKALDERIKQVALEVQSWRSIATYHESVAIALNSNIQQLRAQGICQACEGSGESGIDDAISCSNDPPSSGLAPRLSCRACGVREVSFLLMPCRHLCLCSIVIVSSMFALSVR